MNTFTPSATVAEAFYDNGEFSKPAPDEPWGEALVAIQQMHSRVNLMSLRSLVAGEFSADFIFQASDYHVIATELAFDADTLTLHSHSMLSYAEDGKGIDSSEWRYIAETQKFEFSEDDTLTEVACKIFTLTAEMAYEALHRAHGKLYPMPPPAELMLQVEAAL